MMYAEVIMCLMMASALVVAGEGVCLKRLVTPVTEPSCTVYAENYTCEDYGDQLQLDNTCIKDCKDPITSAYNGQTFQLYNGIDVTSENFDWFIEHNNLEDCMQMCRGDDECLSGSYNSSSGVCLFHVFDQQGDFYDGILSPDEYTTLQNLGPCITFFIKNCY